MKKPLLFDKDFREGQGRGCDVTRGSILTNITSILMMADEERDSLSLSSDESDDSDISLEMFYEEEGEEEAVVEQDEESSDGNTVQPYRFEPYIEGAEKRSDDDSSSSDGDGDASFPVIDEDMGRLQNIEW